MAGMTPTPLALGLHAPLAAALAQLRAVVTSARAFDPSRDRFTIHVACSDYVQSALPLDFTLALRAADAARLEAWHDRNHGDAAQRWVREKLVVFAQDVRAGERK